MSELPVTQGDECPPVIIPAEFPRTKITIGELIDYVAQEATKKVLKNIDS
jgi:hypothetical protein